MVVTLLSASVMIQSFSRSLSLYAESNRKPCSKLNSFSSKSSWQRSPQSPRACRSKYESHCSSASAKAALAPGVIKILPKLNFAFCIVFIFFHWLSKRHCAPRMPFCEASPVRAGWVRSRWSSGEGDHLPEEACLVGRSSASSCSVATCRIAKDSETPETTLTEQGAAPLRLRFFPRSEWRQSRKRSEERRSVRRVAATLSCFGID